MLRWNVAGAVLVGLSSVMVYATPASANTTWTFATKAKLPSGQLLNPGGMLGSRDRTKCTFHSAGGVVQSGDLVYIADKCADGRSAVAWVSWSDKGEVFHRYCRNALGANTAARCNFNWPEKATKTLFIGTYDNGKTDFNYGQGKHFREG